VRKERKERKTVSYLRELRIVLIPLSVI